jgi:hypothetical protein
MDYSQYPDFAEYERQYGPKIRNHIRSLGSRENVIQFLDQVANGRLDVFGRSARNLGKGGTQEQLNRLYSSLDAGPTPKGRYKEKLLGASGSQNKILAAVADTFSTSSSVIKWLFDYLWAPKTFALNKNARSGYMVTRTLFKKRSPAQVYCGQSLIDARKESTVVDYQYADKLNKVAGSFPMTHKIFRQSDWLTTRYGLALRKELRQVIPGVYLGLAYAKGLYIGHFVMYTESNGGVNNSQTPCFRGRVVDPYYY